MFLGNVVTNRINCDQIEWHGSTPKAIEQPDFLVSDDPWFRPVDIKLGPDGALYVADFYNQIIGHYEVPLNHPGRDRDQRPHLADRLEGRRCEAGEDGVWGFDEGEGCRTGQAAEQPQSDGPNDGLRAAPSGQGDGGCA